ncbi:MAG: GNAT family N-acetyltransferase [Alphaproteobacteria bacterium]|nr:GNAT family N-acetyltransferase [Pseudomonadota bacterium]TDI68269.1 MAG: GNAT family N-acetyltransferase [Alphaproteobacteria bacterium]
MGAADRQVPLIPRGFSIRPARLLDAEAIARVHVISWRETYGGIMARTYLHGRTAENRTEMWQSALAQSPPDRVFLVVEDEAGEIVGFAHGGAAREAAYGRRGELYAMYLLKRCQGRGLGRALFEAFSVGLQAVWMGDFYAMVLHGIPSRGFFVKMGGRSCGFGETPLPGRRGGRRLVDERFEWM